MLITSVSDLAFGKLTRMYGKRCSYIWQVGEAKLHFDTTRHVQSQRKLRELYLEATGIVVSRIATGEWNLILQRAFATTTLQSVEELEDMWLRRVAQYCIEELTDDQRLIAKGKPYATNTGILFTSEGLYRHLNKFDDMECLLPEWHSEKILTLLKSKATSTSLSNFKGRALKINNFSCRVDARFYKYQKELVEALEVA